MSLDEQGRAAAAVIAQAFQEDPGFVYAMPDATARTSAGHWLSEHMVQYVRLAGGMVDVAGQPVHAAALWFDVPGRYAMKMGALLRSGLWATPFGVGLGALGRLAKLGDLIDELHEKHAPRPHRYLNQLAVAPSAQGRGVGTALVRPRLEEASRLGIACYLETFSERAVTLYRRLGFELVAEVTPKELPKTWALVREAS